MTTEIAKLCAIWITFQLAPSRFYTHILYTGSLFHMTCMDILHVGHPSTAHGVCMHACMVLGRMYSSILGNVIDILFYRCLHGCCDLCAIIWYIYIDMQHFSYNNVDATVCQCRSKVYIVVYLYCGVNVCLCMAPDKHMQVNQHSQYK